MDFTRYLDIYAYMRCALLTCIPTLPPNLRIILNSGQWVGLNVANLFNNKHYEAFGGDILGVRALFHIVYGW